MKKLRLAVVGVGHLGKEHARILAGMPDVELVGVVDARREQAEAIATRCHCQAFPQHQALLGRIDAVVVATPTVYHHAVARDLLTAGMPLLIEKPIAPTPEQAGELVDLAERQGVVLQVGHIERFNPAFETLKTLPFRPRVIHSRRYSPYTGRSTDIGVVLDMMIHDLDLLLALVGEPACDVAARGLTLMGGHEDVVQAELTFAGGCVAQVQASRVYAAPVRQMEIWSPEGLVGADFHTRRLSLVQPVGRQVEKTEWDCTRDQPDQLTRELLDFVSAVRSGNRPRVSGADGRDAVALAARILECVEAHGPQYLPAPLGPLFVPPAAERAA